MNDRVKLYDKTLKKYGFFSLAVALIVLPSALWSFFFGDGNPDQLIGMTVVGGMALAGALMMVRQYIVIDSKGLEFRNLQKVFIVEWKHIKRISYPVVGVAMIVYYIDPLSGKSKHTQVGAVTRRFGINRTQKGHIEQVRATVQYYAKDYISESTGDDRSSISLNPGIDTFDAQKEENITDGKNA